ncbi:MAG TPA: acyl carrier protein [Candidatus Binatia bacterium]|jgi:acyl carrier protein
MKPLPLEGGVDESIAAAPSLCDRIAGVFSQKLHIEVPSMETDLMETGILDSLTLVELLFHIEQELGLKISLETLDLDHFRSIARIAAYLASQNGARRNGGGAS